MFHRSLLIAILFLPICSFSQETVGGTPFSLRMGWDRSDVPVMDASPFDAGSVAADDAARDRAGVLQFYARFQTLIADPRTAGVWHTLPNGDRVWQLRIRSRGAEALELFGRDLELPNGAVIHVFDATGEQVIGGYTAANRQPDGSFSTHMILGESCFVEYYEPRAVTGQGHFTITRVAHAYRMVGQAKTGACQVDVNCAEGSGWEDHRDAVVRIRVVVPEGVGYCTGTLVNNTAMDCRPFILTAMHCGLGSTSSDFNQYQFRFRYQRSQCGSGTVPTGNTITGCVKRADSNDDGGDDGSDFMLLEMNSAVPGSYQPFYAGWNVSTSAASSGKGIHHPDGDVKKVSTFTAPAANSGWGVIGSHWRVLWNATTNGHGVTEPGSSGSPLFDSNKRIVGTLTGGGSCCTLNGCGSGTGPNVSDYYGKMSYHWTGNPNAPDQKLKMWLDPMNYNVTTLNGYDNPCSFVSIDEGSDQAGMSVHPNPSPDRITVVYPEGTVHVDRIEVRDVSGRLVHVDHPRSMGGHVLDLGGLVHGGYVVTLITDGIRIGSMNVLLTAE